MYYSIRYFIAGNAKQPSILSQMIAEAHEIREKQSVHRAHVINNVAIKNQNQAEDSVLILRFIMNAMYARARVCVCTNVNNKHLMSIVRMKKTVVEQ